MKRTLLFAACALFVLQLSAFGDPPRKLQVKVLDALGNPVQGATVQARYLENVSQDGKSYKMAMPLANDCETDALGVCALQLKEVKWSVAGVSVLRRELTSEDASNLLENAPDDPKERERYERSVYDRVQRVSMAYSLLDPQTTGDAPFTIRMLPLQRITGSIRLDGKPLVGANVMIFPKSSPLDDLFAACVMGRSDSDGKIDLYSAQNEFDRGRIVIERERFKSVLTLTKIPWKPTEDGREIQLDTKLSDYEIRPLGRAPDNNKFKEDPFKNSPEGNRDPFAGKPQ